jgi:ABC-type nitrate/sulfonate/bicarbonate transport system permease component
MLIAGRMWISFPMRSEDFSIDLILPAALPRIFLGVKSS